MENMLTERFKLVKLSIAEELEKTADPPQSFLERDRAAQTGQAYRRRRLCKN